LTDPVTGEPIQGTKADTDKVKVNNGLRRSLRTMIGQLTLMSDERTTRLSAAQSVLRDANPDNLELLETATAEETDGEVKAVMEAARAAIILKPDAGIDEKRAAVDIIATRGGRDGITMLTAALAGAPEDLQPAIQSAIDSLNNTQAAWGIAQNVWYGVS